MCLNAHLLAPLPQFGFTFDRGCKHGLLSPSEMEQRRTDYFVAEMDLYAPVINAVHSILRRRPVALCMFGGLGGDADGWKAAGFDCHIFDRAPLRQWAEEGGHVFHQTYDVMDLDWVALVREHGAYLIAQGPPCQPYSSAKMGGESQERALIAECRDKSLHCRNATGVHTSIENVAAAKSHLRDPVGINGDDIHVLTKRLRFFETSWMDYNDLTRITLGKCPGALAFMQRWNAAKEPVAWCCPGNCPGVFGGGRKPGISKQMMLDALRLRRTDPPWQAILGAICPDQAQYLGVRLMCCIYHELKIMRGVIRSWSQLVHSKPAALTFRQLQWECDSAIWGPNWTLPDCLLSDLHLLPGADWTDVLCGPSFYPRVSARFAGSRIRVTPLSLDTDQKVTRDFDASRWLGHNTLVLVPVPALDSMLHVLERLPSFEASRTCMWFLIPELQRKSWWKKLCGWDAQRVWRYDRNALHKSLPHSPGDAHLLPHHPLAVIRLGDSVYPTPAGPDFATTQSSVPPSCFPEKVKRHDPIRIDLDALRRKGFNQSFIDMVDPDVGVDVPLTSTPVKRWHDNYDISGVDPTAVQAACDEFARGISRGVLRKVPVDELPDVVLVHPSVFVFRNDRWRWCVNCSAPGGINAYMPPRPYDCVKLFDIDASVTPGSHFSKRDGTDYFWIYCIPKAAQRYFGVRHPVNGEIYICERMIFGWSLAPFHADEGGKHFETHLAQKGYPFYRFVDDFLLCDTPEQCVAGGKYFDELWEEIGAESAPHKRYDGPVTDWEGVDLDNRPGHQCYRLQPSKQSKAIALLTDFKAKYGTSGRAPARPLAQLLGFLNFATITIPGGRSFLQRIIDLFRGVVIDWRGEGRVYLRLTRKYRPLYLSSSFWDDWRWMMCALQGNCSRPFGYRRADLHLEIRTDSSGHWGGGGAVHFPSGVEERQDRWDPLLTSLPINLTETLEVLLTLDEFGEERLAGAWITFVVDNMTLHLNLSRERAKERRLAELFRRIYARLGAWGCFSSSAWVSTKEMGRPDLISRGCDPVRARVQLSQRELSTLAARFGRILVELGTETFPDALQPDSASVCSLWHPSYDLAADAVASLRLPLRQQRADDLIHHVLALPSDLVDSRVLRLGKGWRRLRVVGWEGLDSWNGKFSWRPLPPSSPASVTLFWAPPPVNPAPDSTLNFTGSGFRLSSGLSSADNPDTNSLQAQAAYTLSIVGNVNASDASAAASSLALYDSSRTASAEAPNSVSPRGATGLAPYLGSTSSPLSFAEHAATTLTPFGAASSKALGKRPRVTPPEQEVTTPSPHSSEAARRDSSPPGAYRPLLLAPRPFPSAESRLNSEAPATSASLFRFPTPNPPRNNAPDDSGNTGIASADGLRRPNVSFLDATDAAKRAAEQSPVPPTQPLAASATPIAGVNVSSNRQPSPPPTDTRDAAEDTDRPPDHPVQLPPPRVTPARLDSTRAGDVTLRRDLSAGSFIWIWSDPASWPTEVSARRPVAFGQLARVLSHDATHGYHTARLWEFREPRGSANVRPMRSSGPHSHSVHIRVATPVSVVDECMLDVGDDNGARGASLDVTRLAQLIATRLRRPEIIYPRSTLRPGGMHTLALDLDPELPPVRQKARTSVRIIDVVETHPQSERRPPIVYFYDTVADYFDWATASRFRPLAGEAATPTSLTVGPAADDEDDAAAGDPPRGSGPHLAAASGTPLGRSEPVDSVNVTTSPLPGGEGDTAASTPPPSGVGDPTDSGSEDEPDPHHQSTEFGYVSDRSDHAPSDDDDEPPPAQPSAVADGEYGWHVRPHSQRAYASSRSLCIGCSAECKGKPICALQATPNAHRTELVWVHQSCVNASISMLTSNSAAEVLEANPATGTLHSRLSADHGITTLLRPSVAHSARKAKMYESRASAHRCFMYAQCLAGKCSLSSVPVNDDASYVPLVSLSGSITCRGTQNGTACSAVVHSQCIRLKPRVGDLLRFQCPRCRWTDQMDTSTRTAELTLLHLSGDDRTRNDGAVSTPSDAAVIQLHVSSLATLVADAVKYGPAWVQLINLARGYQQATGLNGLVTELAAADMFQYLSTIGYHKSLDSARRAMVSYAKYHQLDWVPGFTLQECVLNQAKRWGSDRSPAQDLLIHIFFAGVIDLTATPCTIVHLTTLEMKTLLCIWLLLWYPGCRIGEISLGRGDHQLALNDIIWGSVTGDIAIQDDARNGTHSFTECFHRDSKCHTNLIPTVVYEDPREPRSLSAAISDYCAFVDAPVVSGVQHPTEPSVRVRRPAYYVVWIDVNSLHPSSVPALHDVLLFVNDQELRRDARWLIALVNLRLKPTAPEEHRFVNLAGGSHERARDLRDRLRDASSKHGLEAVFEDDPGPCLRRWRRQGQQVLLTHMPLSAATAASLMKQHLLRIVTQLSLDPRLKWTTHGARRGVTKSARLSRQLGFTDFTDIQLDKQFKWFSKFKDGSNQDHYAGLDLLLTRLRVTFGLYELYLRNGSLQAGSAF